MKKNFISNDSGATINQYFKEIRKIEVLTPIEEIELTQKIQQGDTKCLDKLIKANLKFVVSIAKKYQGQGILLEDLISEGNMGLVIAAKRFDPSRGWRFISYAVHWIKQSIIQSLNDNSRMIRIPVNVLTEISKQKKQANKFQFDNERLPVDTELLFTDNEETYNEIIIPTCGSLNNLINDDGDEILEFIANETSSNKKYDMDNDHIKRTLNKTLNILNKRERDMVECYFGLKEDKETMTLEGIGDMYNLSKERVRQLVAKSIRKLKSNSSNLKELISE